MRDFVAARALDFPEAMLPQWVSNRFSRRNASDPQKFLPSGF